MWRGCDGQTDPANGGIAVMPSKAATPPWQDRAHRVAVVVFDRPPMFELSVAIEV
jgi:hypothetical protein